MAPSFRQILSSPLPIASTTILPRTTWIPRLCSSLLGIFFKTLTPRCTIRESSRRPGFVHPDFTHLRGFLSANSSRAALGLPPFPAEINNYAKSVRALRVDFPFQVKNIYRHCQFYGFSGHYSSDIALLELEEPFQFSKILLPACLDLFNYADTTLTAGAEGKVAGFGINERGVTSGVLQTLTVPFVPPDECTRSVVAAKNRFYVTAEKFCAGFTNGT